MASTSSSSALEQKEIGNGFFKNQQYSSAIGCYNRALILSPTPDIERQIRSNLALAYQKKEQYVLAEEECDKAIVLENHNPKLWFRRSKVRELRGNLLGALADIRRCVELYEYNDDIYDIGLTTAKGALNRLENEYSDVQISMKREELLNACNLRKIEEEKIEKERKNRNALSSKLKSLSTVPSRENNVAIRDEDESLDLMEKIKSIQNKKVDMSSRSEENEKKEKEIITLSQISKENKKQEIDDLTNKIRSIIQPACSSNKNMATTTNENKSDNIQQIQDLTQKIKLVEEKYQKEKQKSELDELTQKIRSVQTCNTTTTQGNIEAVAGDNSPVNDEATNLTKLFQSIQEKHIKKS